MDEQVLDFYVHLVRGMYPEESIGEIAVRIEDFKDGFSRQNVVDYCRAEAARQHKAESERYHNQVMFENI